MMDNRKISATIYHKPSEPGVGLVIGAWNDTESKALAHECGADAWGNLAGFETSFDAWAFAVTTLLEDPAETIPPKFRQWTNKPKPEAEPVEEAQLTLF
jgi:hypothetical protein